MSERHEGHLLGEHIQKYRETLHISRATLAAEVGLSAGQLEGFEAGEFHMSAVLLRRISHALGASMEELFTGTFLEYKNQ